MGSDNDSSTGVTLRPCPFCGGEARMVHAVGEWWVRCGGCDSNSSMYGSEQAAAEAWNRRAERTCHMAYDEEWSGDELYPTDCYVCSVCGHMTHDGKPRHCPNCGAMVVG